MYLKRMELFGFKSFAEKSELDFSPGIAVVIGPNGCGKSNLVDAVRWALGEQSVKSLRGARMDEVIFSGSESRKALNFAEVSLTFADAGTFLNLDYNEITVTRRLFRTGDSEYYINKSPCRLKDITELFLDTGLGKDVYSVIGQGKVDEIINSRPEERREIFEEAAGILKYKLRKREARRRLEETRENLVRVQDLIFELETQIEPLQSQAEITHHYRALRQRVEHEEKNLLSFRLQGSRAQLNQVNKQLQVVNDALIAVAAQSGLLEEELQNLKSQQQLCHRAKVEQEQKLNALTRSVEYQDSELRLLRERESRHQEQLAQNKQRVQQVDHLLAELAEKKSLSERDLLARTENLDLAETKLEGLQLALVELEAGVLSKELEEQQEKIYQAGARKESALSTIEELNRRLERLQLQKNSLEEERGDLQQKLSQLQESREAMLAQAEDVREQLAAAKAQEKEAVERQEQEKKDSLNLSAQEQKKKEALYGINSRLNLLQEQEATLTGYYRGVKEIMQIQSSLPCVFGPVVDLVSVDEKYIQAIEFALGGSLQYIVAATEDAVREAIRFLKDNNRGWATFLPLDILRPAADPLERYPGWRDLDGVLGKASELVKTDPAYQKAVDYLMASILVCRNLEDASKAARFIKHSCRVVTLDGEVINPGGSIRGGSLPKRDASLPLGRRKEIDALRKQQALSEADLSKISAELNKARDKFVDAGNSVAKAAECRQKLQEQLVILQNKTETVMREESIQVERYQAGQIISGQLAAEHAESSQRLTSLQQQVEMCNHDTRHLENELAGKKESYQRFLDEKKQFETNITETLVKINSYQEQLETLVARIKELTENFNKPTLEKQEKNLEFEKIQRELIDNQAAQKRIAAALADLNEEKAGLIVELESRNKLANQIETALMELEEKGKRLQSQNYRQEKRERELSVEQTRLQTEINYQEIRFKELFRTLDLALLDTDYNQEESQRLVDNLKEDMEALGEVNLGAIEELARLEERINFLKSQQEDLHNGEIALGKVLAEIDQRMEFYFTRAFETIGNNFSQTFQELFDGGKVILNLSDKNNILEAGIEIVAQPPGKKLQNISLLSAGEKVLTAIALVFAILRFKPAPFYLLDEVESALDDTNLARFTSFLKQSSEQAQFILISHRKRTMEGASVLYGVTMPEPGVSRLVSLKMEHNKISWGNKLA